MNAVDVAYGYAFPIVWGRPGVIPQDVRPGGVIAYHGTKPPIVLVGAAPFDWVRAWTLIEEQA